MNKRKKRYWNDKNGLSVFIILLFIIFIIFLFIVLRGEGGGWLLV